MKQKIVKQEILPNAVYTTEEVAELLMLNVVTIQKYVREGKINATLIGDKWYRVTGQAILEFLNASTTTPKGVWTNPLASIIECPHCKSEVRAEYEPQYVDSKGQVRPGYKNIKKCDKCGGMFRLL